MTPTNKPRLMAEVRRAFRNGGVSSVVAIGLLRDVGCTEADIRDVIADGLPEHLED